MLFAIYQTFSVLEQNQLKGIITDQNWSLSDCKTCRLTTRRTTQCGPAGWVDHHMRQKDYTVWTRWLGGPSHETEGLHSVDQVAGWTITRQQDYTVWTRWLGGPSHETEGPHSVDQVAGWTITRHHTVWTRWTRTTQCGPGGWVDHHTVWTDHHMRQKDSVDHWVDHHETAGLHSVGWGGPSHETEGPHSVDQVAGWTIT